MSDLAALKSVLLPIHGVLGGVSMLAGGAALLLRKSQKNHPLAGRVFSLGMALAIVVSTPVIIVSCSDTVASYGFPGGQLALQEYLQR